MTDPLERFARDWLLAPVLTYPMETMRAGAHHGVTLCRQGPFLVQLWISEPNSTIAPHAHPNAHGWAVVTAGEILFAVSGRVVREPERVPFGDGLVPIVRVPAGASHRARIGAAGGSFLAITHWFGEPTSVHLDWSGNPLDEQHADELRKA
jgi:hypothetical protein